MYSLSSAVLYVGQTVNTLRTRINGHRSWMKKKKEEDKRPDAFKRKDDGALAEHLKQSHNLTKSEDFDKSYKFHVLVTNPTDFNKCEQLWVDRLSTMHPLGLNIDKPCVMWSKCPNDGNGNQTEPE